MQPKVWAAEVWAGRGIVGVGQRLPVEAANENLDGWQEPDDASMYEHCMCWQQRSLSMYLLYFNWKLFSFDLILTIFLSQTVHDTQPTNSEATDF